MEEGTATPRHQGSARGGSIATTILRWSAGLYMVFSTAAAMVWLGLVLDGPAGSEPWGVALPLGAILAALMTGSAALALADLVDHVCHRPRAPMHD